MELDSCAIGWVTQADPVVRDGIPLVFYNHLVPKGWGWRRETGDPGGKDEEHED